MTGGQPKMPLQWFDDRIMEALRASERVEVSLDIDSHSSSCDVRLSIIQVQSVDHCLGPLSMMPEAPT